MATAGQPLSDQRVLLLHNRYRVPGGEERFVDGLEELLREAGSFVVRHERDSSELSAGRAAAGLVAGGLDPQAVAAAVRQQQISVVHAHNVHPVYGWRALAAAREAGAATVLHLHNHRIFCATGVAFRDGDVCYDCAPRSVLTGLRHRCRGSLAEGAAYAAGIGLWQRRLLENSDLVVVPTERLGGELVRLGVLASGPATLAPWLPDGEFAQGSQAAGGKHALYAGRLSADKGVLVAIRASAASGMQLLIAGSGPEEREARELAAQLGAPVTFAGQLDRAALAAARADAFCAVVPSLCQDVMPFSAIEALAAGLPVVTSNRPGLEALTAADLVAPAGDAEALGQILSRLSADRALVAQLGADALGAARERYSAAHAQSRLANLYAHANSASSVH